MGTVRYFDNNQRVQFHGNMDVYQNTKLTPDSTGDGLRRGHPRPEG